MKREMRKKEYESADVEIVLLEFPDIVTASGGGEVSLDDLPSGDGGWSDFG